MITFLNYLFLALFMAKRYDSREAEPRILEFWDKEGIFKFDPDAEGEVYSVDTPPPTVSGKMHIGHAFQYTQFDFVARYKRLQGFNVFMPFGTDDNGLPTERLIEKTKGVKARKMGRQEFISLCNETLKEIRPGFIDGWRKIGMSCDFSLCYSTIDDDCRRRSQWSFLDLVKRERAYRKEAPALWCPHCATAVAQVDCTDVEKDSTFNDVVFKVGGEDLVIATTRPELLPACVAVFYHPEDDRYKKYEGLKATVPLFGYDVPIFSDERVDPSKGTGIVMCCTFGDKNDAEWFKAFDLPLRTAISKEGLMTTLCGPYEGLRIHDARKDILKDLKAKGLLVQQKQIKHDVKVHERCDTEIEILNSKQWFIRYLDLRDEMIKWGSEPEWHPGHMIHRYDNWVKGLQWDWLISRQRFFGIPFPVWYCKECDEPVFADESDLPVDPLKDSPKVEKCPKCGCSEFVPENDVQDTWPTSALTPQHAVGLVDEKYRDRLFPMDLRPQGQDIITFWLFNTTVKSHLHFGVNPWKHVMISGYVTDPHGDKMSKSKGNIVEPDFILQKFSADALRYWSAGVKLGDDVRYQEKDLVAGDKLVNKLWNACKFVFMHVKDRPSSRPSLLMDEWVLARLSDTVEQASLFFDNYEYTRAKLVIESFFWEFCDNYLELVKNRLYEGEGEDKESALAALYESMFAILRLFAPFLPFITEELYQIYFVGNESSRSVHNCSWPSVAERDENVLKTGDAVVCILGAVRKKKSEAKLSVKADVPLLRVQTSLDLGPALADLKAAGSIKKIEFGNAEEELADDLFVSVEL